MERTRPREQSEAFGRRAEPLIAERMGKQKVGQPAGRPAKSDRQMLGAML